MQLPEDLDVSEGQSGLLRCDVVGSPRPDVSWTFNDRPVERQRFDVAANGDLTLTGVVRGDAGTYRCTAANALGKITAAAQVRVLSEYILLGVITHAVGSLPPMFSVPSGVITPR